jgi:hypothetical protein
MKNIVRNLSSFEARSQSVALAPLTFGIGHRPGRLRPFRAALAALACAAALAHAPVAQAVLTLGYHITVTTSPLIGHSAGPFSLDFQLTDGSGLGDGNNTATISNLSYSGGGATGLATLSGGASGNLASGASLTDTAFFNEVFQSFTPGNTLSFDLSLTSNADAGGTPDAFSFAILDSSLYNLQTTGVNDTLLFINLNGGAPTVQTGSTLNPAGVTITAVPEPSAMALAGLGLAALYWRGRRTLG